MQPLDTRLSSDYKLRLSLLAGLFALIGLPTVLLALKHGRWEVLLAVMVLLGFGALVFLWGYLRAPQRLDAEGLVRRDGKRLRWADFIEIKSIAYSRNGGTGFSHDELRFTSGKSDVYPLMFDNLGEILAFVRALPRSVPNLAAPAKAAAEASAETQPAQAATVPAAPSGPCPLCAELGTYCSGLQIAGRESEDRFLPTAVGKLRVVKEIDPHHSELLQCPDCGDYFLYRSTYEYLVYGSEDEQTLTRLGREEAERLRSA